MDRVDRTMQVVIPVMHLVINMTYWYMKPASGESWFYNIPEATDGLS